MKVTPALIALLGLFSETKPVAKLLKFATDSAAVDEQLRPLPVGGEAVVNIPDDLDIKFQSRTGKKFSIDGLAIKRLRD